jgi:stage IV sporulation protein FB
MIRFQFLGFPIVIHWIFWLTAALLGGANGASSPEAIRNLVAFVIVAAASVLIHELGHALTMRHYGDRQVGIMLHGFGGFARGSRWLSRQEDIFVSAAGPFAQLAAAVVMWWVLDAWNLESGVLRNALVSFKEISIFWALLNLLPIIPLDGGHISRALFGPDRLKPALTLSMICSAGMALYALNHFGIISVAFFGMFAWNNYKEMRGEPQTPWMESR